MALKAQTKRIVEESLITKNFPKKLDDFEFANREERRLKIGKYRSSFMKCLQRVTHSVRISGVILRRKNLQHIIVSSCNVK